MRRYRVKWQVNKAHFASQRDILHIRLKSGQIGFGQKARFRPEPESGTALASTAIYGKREIIDRCNLRFFVCLRYFTNEWNDLSANWRAASAWNISTSWVRRSRSQNAAVRFGGRPCRGIVLDRLGASRFTGSGHSSLQWVCSLSSHHIMTQYTHQEASAAFYNASSDSTVFSQV